MGGGVYTWEKRVAEICTTTSPRLLNHPLSPHGRVGRGGRKEFLVVQRMYRFSPRSSISSQRE